MNYGIYGGQFVSPEMIKVLEEVEKNFKEYCFTEEFRKEYTKYLTDYVGRPSKLFYAENLTKHLGGAKIYLKREDLNHTGSHKINNALGQILLAKKMNKKHIIAETGAGQHGVATATVCALFNMKCTIFMGEEDIRRQRPNVERMKMLGAEVKSVTRGTKTLKEAVDEALEYLMDNMEDTFYLIGSAVGPHPYPAMVREFQKVIGEEAKKQILEREGRLPDVLVACVGGGSNAIGLFNDFIKEKNIEIYGVEGAGKGIETGMHASAFARNKVGVLHGMKTYVYQDENGEAMPAYSISAGLDYPGVGPEHAYFHDEKRVNYVSVTDEEALEGFFLLCKTEGIIPALESSHAISYASKIAKNYSKDKIIIINLSGRGDKDLGTIMSMEKSKEMI